MLYGPPGTGKTFLAKACATEAQATFFSISASSLMSKYLGETEKQVKNLFDLARERSPSIIFIDEIDSIASARGENENETMRRVKTEILVQMQGVGTDNKGLLVLGATNLPWEIDPAARRRFERRIYISLPDEVSRSAIIQHHVGQTPHEITEEEFMDLAKETDGYSGSDLSSLTKDAIMAPLRKVQTATRWKPAPSDPSKWVPTFASDPAGTDMNLFDMEPSSVTAPDICLDDFMAALDKIKPSVSQDDLADYEKWTEEFGADG